MNSSARTDSGAPDTGARIRAVRLARHLSLRELAARIGVSVGTLSNLETGKTGVTVARLTELAAALGTSSARLLDERSDTGTTTDPVRARSPAPGSDPSGVWSFTDWSDFTPMTLGAVLDAALVEFVEKGYAECSIRDVAARAGLSVPGLYHHYPSKQDILADLLLRPLRDLLERAHASCVGERDPVERFRRLVRCLVLYNTHRPRLSSVANSEMRSLSPDRYEHARRLRAGFQSLVDRETAVAAAAGDFRVDHPHEAARAVVTMCVAICTWYRPGGSLSPEDVATLYTTYALRLVGHAPDQDSPTPRATDERTSP